ncbi:MAG: UbiA prenyltransferase family protein [Candidatus Aenigmarchaeota archaeon]|nr:UbiA prenyltransferase family protein [Candidatus Aenigmarchaeota archaeon]
MKYLQLLRPHQWYKNLVIFIGLVFSQNLFNIEYLIITSIGFIVLCSISGANYIINDIVDLEKDRKHPVKKKRPIASGEINKTNAVIFAVLLIIFSFSVSFWINFNFGLIVLSLFLLTQTYSFFLKKVCFLDVLLISMNFVLRAVAGAIIISVRVSPWLIMSCFFVALFLALGKRKAELNLRINSSAQTRESLRIYTKEIIDTLIFIPLVMVLVCYTMYCIFVFPVTQILRDYFLFLTLPIITFAIFRYVYLSNKGQLAETPDKILQDKQMLFAMILWVMITVLFLYV